MSYPGWMLLRVARRIPRTESEGPGARYALWVQGCSIRCEGCCNPEMFSDRGGEEVDVAALAREVLDEPGLEGLSILGGEPFEQAGPLAELASLVRKGGLSVMVFSGFVREELEACADPHTLALLAAADLLADGPFVASQPGSRWRWLGSQNQRMHFLSERYTPEDARFFGDNTVDIRLVDGRLEISGWAPAVKALGIERLRRRG